MDGIGVRGGSDNNGGSGAPFEFEVLVTNVRGDDTIPATILVGVLGGDEGCRVNLGLVKTSERNLTILDAVGKLGNTVRRDGLADQPVLRKRLNGARDAFGKAGLGQTQDTIEFVGAVEK